MVSPKNYDDRFLGFDSEGEQILLRGDKHDEVGRTPFEKDVDRIKYTREFRRLKDVTQVARVGESYLYHDRLSHSLKVAQVGRRFAEYILRKEAEQEGGLGSEEDEATVKNSELSIRLFEGEGSETLSTELKRELDPNVIEVACLAHDLGHPPFGHIAEDELDHLLQEYTNPWFEPNTEGDDWVNDNWDDDEEKPSSLNDCDEYAVLNGVEPQGIRFEGNAQSFRILTRLASHYNSESGLGLTISVLNAMQKYPYGRGEWVDKKAQDWNSELSTKEGRSKGKFGYYKTDEMGFQTIRSFYAEEGVRTISAEIMDYADDLTYAIHDLTDFYMDGRLPLDRLFREAAPVDEYENVARRELDKLEEKLGYAGDYDGITPTDVIEALTNDMYVMTEGLLLFEPFEGTRRQRDELEKFTSFLIEFYLNGVYMADRDVSELEEDSSTPMYIVLEESDGSYELVISDILKQHVNILQEITEYYVIDDSALQGQQRGQRQIIRELFHALYEEASKENLDKSAIPRTYSDWIEGDGPPLGEFKDGNELRCRVVVDLIAALTEIQVVDLHKRLTGDVPGSLQNQIIR